MPTHNHALRSHSRLLPTALASPCRPFLPNLLHTPHPIRFPSSSFSPWGCSLLPRLKANKYIDVVLTPVRANLRANAFTPYSLTSNASVSGLMPMEVHLVTCPGLTRLRALKSDAELMNFDYTIVKSEQGEVGVTIRGQADPTQMATFDLINDRREQIRLCHSAVAAHGGFDGPAKKMMRVLIRPATLTDRKKHPK